MNLTGQTRCRYCSRRTKLWVHIVDKAEAEIYFKPYERSGMPCIVCIMKGRAGQGDQP
jgi:hypothetical protein